MTDGCGRTIDYLRLSVTDLCNYRCRYCMSPEGIAKRDHREMLSIEELAEIGSAAVQCGVKKIRLTGGSPWSAGDFWSFAASSGQSPLWKSCVSPPTAPFFLRWRVRCGRRVWTG